MTINDRDFIALATKIAEVASVKYTANFSPLDVEISYVIVDDRDGKGLAIHTKAKLYGVSPYPIAQSDVMGSDFKEALTTLYKGLESASEEDFDNDKEFCFKSN